MTEDTPTASACGSFFESYLCRQGERFLPGREAALFQAASLQPLGLSMQSLFWTADVITGALPLLCDIRVFFDVSISLQRLSLYKLRPTLLRVFGGMTVFFFEYKVPEAFQSSPASDGLPLFLNGDCVYSYKLCFFKENYFFTGLSEVRFELMKKFYAVALFVYFVCLLNWATSIVCSVNYEFGG